MNLRPADASTRFWFLLLFLCDVCLFDASRIQGQGVERVRYYYYAIENLDNGQVIRRGKTTEAGIPAGEIILAPVTSYREWLYRADNGYVGFSDFRTPESGQRFTIPRITLGLPLTRDSDGDGLTDDAEFVVGTNPTKADTDGDGINDGAAIALGLDPGAAARTGIVGSANLAGSAVDVCAFNDVVVVAQINQGITVFNVFNRMSPLIIAQVNTPGAAQRVACSGSLIAVADGSAGLAVVDITDPGKTRIGRQVNLGGFAQAVVSGGGIAYVGLNSGQTVAVDLSSGSILGQVMLPGAALDLALEGDHLFALSPGALHSISLRDGDFELEGSVPAPADSQRLAVGGSVAYVSYSRGYYTYSTTNPAVPALILAGNQPVFWGQMAVNGSGLGLANTGTGGIVDDVSVYDVKNPAQNGIFQSGFATPGLAQAIAIYNGLAYVADGSGGLQVINYLGFDTSNQPPTITLQANFSILNPTNAVAEGGQLVRVTANVADDVQVRNVEFYIDGIKVATDGNFPFEYGFVAPIRRLTKTSFKLSARASDTGGNFTFTPEMKVEVLPATRRPRITRFNPRDASAVGGVASITAFFSEPIETNNLADAVRLVSAGSDGIFGTSDDGIVTNYSIVFREDVLGLFINFPTNLAYGKYHISLSTNISDLNSNSLVAGADWQFRVVPCLEEIPGLVAWWSGDGTAEDIVGGNNGALVGRATSLSGYDGEAFSFSGGNYVEVPDSPDLKFSGNSPMTVEFWAYPTASPAIMHYLGKRVGCGTWQFQLAYDGRGIHFSGGEPVAGSGRFLPLNEWHHLAATFNGSEVEIYIDAISVLKASHTLGPENSSPLLIGGSGSCGNGFIGLMDEVTIFNRALSSNEISDIYSVGTVGKCQDIAPRAMRFFPADRTVVESNRIVCVYFNKAIDPLTLDSNSVFLTEAGADGIFGTEDDAGVTALGVTYSNAMRAAYLLLTNELPIGHYRITATRTILDLGHKPLYAQKEGTFWVLPGGPEGDADNDGMTNAEEMQHGTNPTLADTDGDGWTDEIEVSDGTDALNANSKPKTTYFASPQVEFVFPGADELLPLGPGLAVAGPEVEIVFPGPDEINAVGIGTTVARPPVELVFPGTDEIPELGLGIFVTLPPVEIVLTGLDEADAPGVGTTLAHPPIEIDLTAADEVAGSGIGTTLAQPQVEMTLPGLDELYSLLNGLYLARPPLEVKYITNSFLLNMRTSAK